MTIKQIVKKYSRDLKNITHIPQKEVEILVLHLLNKNVIWLHLNYNSEFTQENELKKLVEKRATNYPLEYIINKASFYGETFLVKEGVLIPRPETEILVENAYNILKDMKSPKILEIGIGSGIISIMLAKLIENIEVIGVDINDKALDLATQNAQKLEVYEKVNFIKSDLFENIKDINFDMVISNPPYIANNYKLPENVKYEPKNALFGGEVGDELLQDIIKETYDRKIPYLLCEMGYDQKEPLTKLIKTLDVESFSFYKDYSDFDRGFTVKFK